MAMSNAERQRRYRERRKAQEPVVRYHRPPDRRSRPERWQDAVRTLREIQDEYREWLDKLPDSLRGSALGHKLAAICKLDLDKYDVVAPSPELPQEGEPRDQ